MKTLSFNTLFTMMMLMKKKEEEAAATSEAVDEQQPLERKNANGRVTTMEKIFLAPVKRNI